MWSLVHLKIVLPSLTCSFAVYKALSHRISLTHTLSTYILVRYEVWQGVKNVGKEKKDKEGKLGKLKSSRRQCEKKIKESTCSRQKCNSLEDQNRAIGQDVRESKLSGRRRKGGYWRAKSWGSGAQGFGIPSLTRVFRATRGEWLEVSESRWLGANLPCSHFGHCRRLPLAPIFTFHCISCHVRCGFHLWWVLEAKSAMSRKG